MRIRHKLWLEEDGGLLFGEGRQNLLKAVAELGSLSAAARKLKMSYRAAWGRVRASERRLGIKLLQRASTGRSLVLTEAGQQLLDQYTQFEKEADRAIDKIGRKIFGSSGRLDLDGDAADRD
ncbi:MAG: LysR family transcriptional regulator [Deltaproteobacteria bacterium]|nr:LysR family transcriptional regulator [Deltaproteobacteria bacterium]